MKTTLIIFLILMTYNSFAKDKAAVPDGKIETPYEACKNVLIVANDKYAESKEQWDKYGKECGQPIQVTEDVGIKSLDPFKEGLQYLTFSQKVAQKIISNLQKNQTYLECSMSCFSGKKSCEKVKCEDRKKEIAEAMKVYSRKIRMELALSDDAPGIHNVAVQNAVKYSKDPYFKDLFINSNLHNFETGLPNPIGNTGLSERELTEARRRLASDHKKLEKKFKESGTPLSYHDWMSVELMKNFDEHQTRYRDLIYQEAPIFSVIERPVKLEKDQDPVWSDAQIAKAFSKLIDNAKKTEEKVKWSLNNSKLEFSRIDGEALKKWIGNLGASKEKNDLLYYVGMKNPVEEVLKENPSDCGIATSMEARIRSKDLQNAGIILVGSLGGGLILKGASKAATATFRIGRALSGEEAAGITGLALGGSFLMDSFRSYGSTVTEASTTSGLGNEKESKSLRSGKEIEAQRDNIKLSLAFAPLDAIGAWGVGKTLYNSLAKQMAKDLPEIKVLIKKSKLDTVARDQLVDQWLSMKVKKALANGVLNKSETKALQGKEAKVVLESFAKEIEKKNPAFFKNPDNMDYFLKLVATKVKKEAGDPEDLAEKAKQLLLHFNTEAKDDFLSANGPVPLLKIYENAIQELRVAAKDDPVTYLKFSRDADAQNKIYAKALKRSGIKGENLPCAIP